MTYDPTIGEWLEEDPIEFEGGDTNLRRYVGNDPTNEIDPSGLQAQNLQPGKPAPPPVIGAETEWPSKAVGFTEQLVQVNKLKRFQANPIAIPTPNATTNLMDFLMNSATIGGFDYTWAHRNAKEIVEQVPLFPGGPLGTTANNVRDVQNVLQHAAWLAWMYVLYGEQTANDIAWVHEQYGSDGWSDTLRDFYNNKKGIEIGKEVEKMLGKGAIADIRGTGFDFKGMVADPLKVADPITRAWKLIQDLVLKNAKAGNLAVLPIKDYKIPNYNPAIYIRFILTDAQRFWDSQVFYNPNPADKKPPVRPN